MSPTLAPGDYLIGRRRSQPHRGSIVAFEADERTVVKRVIARNATVVITGGVVTVDGEALPDPWWSGATRPDGQWKVGPDEVFVLGDRRSDSTSDSRDRGAIGVDDLLGVVEWRYWPLARVGRLSGPPRSPSGGEAPRPAR